MSFGYKVYANPQVNAGKYFLSKVVLKNSGGKPIHDLTVSYVADWAGTSTTWNHLARLRSLQSCWNGCD
jgi:hypothetical protein